MRAAIVVSILALASIVHAHGMRTAYIEVAELEPGHASVHLRLTAPDPSLAIVAADGCTLAPQNAASELDVVWLLDCPGAIAGHTLAVHGLGPIIGDAVAQITFADGSTRTELVRASAPTVELSRASESTLAVAGEFVGLGLRHIATGYDHLLFLLLLVLLLRDVRSVLLAETAFTLSHSLSFSATALGWIHVSSAAAELCIALSLVLLALEIDVRAAAAQRWRGVGMALVFGFVHGLGFAGGLREVGLPEHAIGAALVGFGGGIELGQVAFLAVVLGLLHASRRWAHLAHAKLVALYAIGGLAAYWVIVRAGAVTWR
jgi:HupE/UreJ protein